MRLTTDERRRAHHRVYEALREARRSRYPVVLVLGMGDQLTADVWEDFAADNELALLDMLDCAQRPDFQRAAAAWPTLVNWLREQAVAGPGVLVIDLDAVVTQWDERDRRRFYLKLLKSETRESGTGTSAPIVALSSLALDYQLPEDARDQGIVLDLLT